ncbi:MAG: hypothetical protein RLZZ546_1845 [Bacteroidota bacterium]|jgi:glyoxylase-like metal-dependent hydrolase (beta-lactamase superfamily II)/rhodanese-related sulfurtransferase
MQIEQIYTGCLAQGAYYIVSNGEAAIIDPLRETMPYIARLDRDKVKLKYIFETHFHADFVSGHIDLSKKTGAPIIYGPDAEPSFDFISAKDGQIFEIGKIKIKVLHTPGHTLESCCYLLLDEEGKEHAVFTGDTLFIGDVGRPDLAQKSSEYTQEQMASILFRSLRTKLMTLDNDTIVYPAHGAGSACGKKMSKETMSTIGIQKNSNYALRQNLSESEFIAELIDGLATPPAYFGMNVSMNKHGYESFDTVFSNGMRSLSVEEFVAVVVEKSAMILDTRHHSEFAQGFIPQSINIGIAGDFAPWVGAMIGNVSQAIVCITEGGKEEETITRLSRVGFDHVLGHLRGGFESWIKAEKEIDYINRISAEKFASNFVKEKDIAIDVRKESEFASEHVEKAYNKPLSEINLWIKDINPDQHFYVYCAGGYRSMIAASILQARGYRNFSEVNGGFKDISSTAIAKTDLVCQSTTE